MKEAALVTYFKGGTPKHHIPVTFKYTPEEGKWVGVCIELGTSTFADTLDQVREELGENVVLQLTELGQLTDIWEYLAENHVEIIDASPATEATKTWDVAVASNR